MHGKKTFFLTAALFLSFFTGCMEGENSINQEVAYVRRRAYEEWKASRDRGETPEAKAEGPLSLDDAVKLALQYNKPLQAAVQNRDIARGQRVSKYGVILPSFSVVADANRVENFHRPATRTHLDDFGFGLKVTQPIWNGGYIPASLRTANLNVALADEEIRDAVQDLVSQVANLYYDVLLAQHMVETHREALVSAEAQLRMVTEKKKQETATDYDVLRAQVDVATYRAKMISEQNAIDTGRVALLKAMGVSQDSEITFSDKLEFLPMRPVFERAVELASANRSDLRQTEISARIQQEAIRIAESAFWPALSANFSQNWGGSFDGGYVDRNPWSVGLSAGVTFGADNWGNLQSTRAQARQAEINRLNAQETTLQEIRREMNNLTNAEEMVNALVVNQNAAREALRLVLVGYQAGVKTEVDVTDARKALTEVMGQYYSAMSDHTRARLNLQVAMGVLGPCVVTDGAQMPPLVPIANIEEFAAKDYVPPKAITMPAVEDDSSSLRLREREVGAAPRKSGAKSSSTEGKRSRNKATSAARKAEPEVRTSSRPRGSSPEQAEPLVAQADAPLQTVRSDR